MKSLLKFSSSAVVVYAFLAFPAFADEVASETVAKDGDIVVSARKREENLQDVPISITAFTGEALEKKGAITFESLSLNNPNVKIAPQSGVAPIASNIAIRGNIQSSGTLQVDPSVGVYVDGHLLAHTFGTAGLTVDVDSVQTLKGPQGTLFGRNTTGGAMLIKTRDPRLGETSGYVQADLGEVATRRLGGAINIPVGDKIALRLVYQNNSAGDYETLADGRKLGRKNEEVLRGKLLIQPTEGTTLVLSAEKLLESATATSVVPTQPNNPIYQNVAVSPFPTAVGQGNVVPLDPRANNHFAKVDAQFYTGQLKQEIGDGAIQLLGSHRVYKIRSALTLPPQFGYTFQDKPFNKDTSLELQYNGKLFAGALDVAAGAYYFEEDIEEAQNTFLYSGVQRTSRDLFSHTKSTSAYAQGTWHVSDALNLTAGLRYTDDSKRARLYAATLSATTEGTAAAALVNPVATYDKGQEKLNYLVSADYSFGDRLMIYASHATGYRAGGASVDRAADLQPTNPGYLQTQSFTAENVRNYEIGFKAEPIEGMLTINGAAFWQDYQDYQYTAIVNAIRILKNTDARIKGAEIDGRLRLGQGTTISADLGFTDAKVHDAANVSNGQKLPYIPRVTWGVSFDQSFELGAGKLDFVANYSWRSKWWSVMEDPSVAASAAQPSEEVVSSIRSLGLLNLSLTYANGPYSLTAYANNVTDEKSYGFITYTSAGAINYGSLGMPRVIGVRARYSF